MYQELVYRPEVLGSFSNDNGDGNENVKRAIGLLIKTITLHVHHAFLYISLPLAGRQRRENAYFHILWRMQTNHDEFSLISL